MAVCNISVIYYVWVMIKKIRVISEDNQLTRTSNLFEFLFLFRTMLHPAVRDSFNFFLIPFEIKGVQIVIRPMIYDPSQAPPDSVRIFKLNLFRY